MNARVAIGTSSFAAEDQTPLRLLQKAGVEIVRNPLGRRLAEAEIIAHLQGADGLLAGLEPLSRTVLTAADSLRAVARVGIGLDNVDLEAAQELGILVSNTPDPPAHAVAELTVAAALALSRGLLDANSAMHDGRWEKRVRPGLRDARVLVIGFGRIGRKVAEHLIGFDANVAAVDPYVPDSVFGPVRRMDLADGLAWADVVALHAAGRKQVLGSAEFALMQEGVILLNGARAELVHEQALLEALDSGKVGAAWFDVFWDEPYSGPLRQHPQVLLTPHVGTYTRACRREMETEAVQNLLQDLERSAGSRPAARLA